VIEEQLGAYMVNAVRSRSYPAALRSEGLELVASVNNWGRVKAGSLSSTAKATNRGKKRFTGRPLTCRRAESMWWGVEIKDPVFLH